MLRFTTDGMDSLQEDYVPKQLPVGTVLEDGDTPDALAVMVAQTSKTTKRFIVVNSIDGNWPVGEVFEGPFWGRPRVPATDLDVDDYPWGTVIQGVDSDGGPPILWRTIRPELKNADGETVWAVNLNDPTHFLLSDIVRGRVIPDEAIRVEHED